MTDVLHTKHRPQDFESVVGQSHMLGALQRVIAKKQSQQFIFSGPSGTGKTTLARITAYEVGCDDRDILEVDAATFSGVDKMREVQTIMKYKPMGGGGSRAIIVDEAHGLSKQAWDALLKPVEEPGKNVYWMFCTTNAAKIPQTIKTRCTSLVLKEVSEADLERLITRVAKLEKMDVPAGVRQVIVREAYGSPRQALSNLATCAECENGKDAARLLHVAQESDATIELCRFLLKPGSWAKAMVIFDKLKEESPEGVRIVVCNYMASVLKGVKGDPTGVLKILEDFATPYNSAEGHAPLLLSIGRCLHGE